MAVRQLFRFLILLVSGLGLIPGQADATQAGDPTARCNALQTTDFSHIPDALTQVTDVKLVAASSGAAGYCEVRGYVAPQIGFLLRLPSDNWNGKFLELGCGASSCGTIDDQAFVHPFKCTDPLRRGYACIVSDGGNKSTGVDMKWAYNNPQAVVDYFVRASHVAALAGKAIAERYYDKAPDRSYFMGCSSGGLQAYWEVQKFPWDFDGIVAGAPSDWASDSLLRGLWGTRAFLGPDGKSLLGKFDLEALHQSVVTKCDLNDETNQCLTGPQIEAVEKIYRGPTTSKGEQIATSSAMKGSELTWFDALSPSSPFLYNYISDWFRYFYFQPNPGPAWKPEEFDFDHDYKRLGAGDIIEPVNPDLSRFKATGAKLLVYGGWTDAIGGALNPVDYYEKVEKLIGQQATTQDFFRVFMVPGMNHCGGGDGAYAVDWLSYLESWVEKGHAPEKLIGYHPQGQYAWGDIGSGVRTGVPTGPRKRRVLAPDLSLSDPN